MILYLVTGSRPWKSVIQLGGRKWLEKALFLNYTMVLIICEFHISRFSCFPQSSIHEPKINTCSIFMIIHRPTQSSEIFELSLTCTPSWGWTRQYSAFFFSALKLQKMSFLWFAQCHVFHISMFAIGNFIIQNGPQI